MKKPMKKAGMKKMSEYGGMEMYGSKKAMMKHEKMEGKAMEKKEKSMYAKAAKKVVKKKK
jgi:hypothetical protein